MRFTFHVDANIDDPDDAAMFARLVGDYLLGLDDVTHVTGGGSLIRDDAPKPGLLAVVGTPTPGLVGRLLREREERAHAMIRATNPARFVHDLTYSALVSELREHLAGVMHATVTAAPLGEMVAVHAAMHRNRRPDCPAMFVHSPHWWRLLAVEDEDLLGEGRCDTCGAPCGPDGCLTDPTHEASIPG